MREYKRLPFEGLKNCRDLGGTNFLSAAAERHPRNDARNEEPGADERGSSACFWQKPCGRLHEDDRRCAGADIVADYQVSAVYQKENPLFELVPEEMKRFLRSDPETMKFFLKEACEKDYLSLLKKNGLTTEVIQSIREKVMI